MSAVVLGKIGYARLQRADQAAYPIGWPGDRARRHAQELAKQFRDTTLGVLRVTFLSAFALELIATISTAVVAVEVGLRLLQGQLTFQPALFVLILAPEFYMPLRMVGLRFHAGMSGTSAARRIFDILDTPPPSETQINTDTGFHLKNAITFENVGFTYPGGDHPVLREINFSINPGQRVALVGPSGGGKSTLASVLLRFISPTEGRIKVGEKDLYGYPPRRVA